MKIFSIIFIAVFIVMFSWAIYTKVKMWQEWKEKNILAYETTKTTETNKIELIDPINIKKLSENDTIYSINFENHQYIVWKGWNKGNIIHSPNCPCVKLEK